MADPIEDVVGRRDGAVIGALLDHRGAERPPGAPGLLVLHQRMHPDRLAQPVLVECCMAHRADHAVRVARGLDEDRRGAGQEQRALVRRLVVVAVEQHQVALCQQRAERDLVRGRGAVEHEIGALGAEDLRRLLLRQQRRALVGEQVAHLHHRVVEIVAKDRIAQMLDEDPADRAASIERAAIMAGAGPEHVALLGIIDQRAEERRLERVGVLAQPGHQVLADEVRRLLGQEDEAVDMVEHVDRDLLQGLAAHQDDDRHVQAALADQLDQVGGLAVGALLAPVDHHAADRGVGADRQLGVVVALRVHDGVAVLLDLGEDLLQPRAFQVVRIEARHANQELEPARIFHSMSPHGRTRPVPVSAAGVGHPSILVR